MSDNKESLATLQQDKPRQRPAPLSAQCVESDDDEGDASDKVQRLVTVANDPTTLDSDGVMSTAMPDEDTVPSDANVAALTIVAVQHVANAMSCRGVNGRVASEQCRSNWTMTMLCAWPWRRSRKSKSTR
jgi:hypothetical protein